METVRWIVFLIMPMVSKVFALLAGLLLIGGGVVLAWNTYQERQETKTVTSGFERIITGQSAGEVMKLLGDPDFRDRPVSASFLPARDDCGSGVEEAWIYQPSGIAGSLVVYFGNGRVMCKKESGTFRLSHE